MKKPGVLLIAYKRYEYLEETLELLIRQNFDEIFIAVDGAKSEADRKSQQPLLNYILNIQERYPSIKVWRREYNLGIAASVITAIDWFFYHVESGIIIEDDLVLSKTFLDFCQLSLDKFASNSKVWIISGSRFLPGDSSDVQYSNYPIIWGWATWRNRWEEVRKIYPSQKILRKKFIWSKVYFFWYIGTLRVLTLRIDTWDIPLAYMMWEQGALCVIPPFNLVSNRGFDSFAVHTKENIFPLNLSIREHMLDQLKFESADEKSLRKNNYYLEKEVFKIRSRHNFLVIKIIFESFFFARVLKKNLLFNKISQISIPKKFH